MKKIVLHSQEQLRFVDDDDIAFCKSDNCYTHINLVNNENLLISQSLSTFSKKLCPNKFIRVSQSYLVNIQSIKQIDKKKKLMHLSNLAQIHFTTSIKEVLRLIEKGTSS